MNTDYLVHILLLMLTAVLIENYIFSKFLGICPFLGVSEKPETALGMGFADTIRDFQNKTLDECRKLGVNDSMIHEDFMIGSADLSIDAVCEDGKTVAIFRNGTWAF